MLAGDLRDGPSAPLTATAQKYAVPLVTADAKIREYRTLRPLGRKAPGKIQAK
jgi:PIN domain nuclease of toxin-antitoxin system